MPLTKKQSAVRASAVRAVNAYEKKKLLLQDKMRHISESAREEIISLMRDWGEAATEVDEALDRWAQEFDYESDPFGPSPFVNTERNLAQHLDDPEVLEEVLSELFTGDSSEAFPSESDEESDWPWTAEGAIGIIEQTELPQSQE